MSPLTAILIFLLTIPVTVLIIQSSYAMASPDKERIFPHRSMWRVSEIRKHHALVTKMVRDGWMTAEEAMDYFRYSLGFYWWTIYSPARCHWVRDFIEAELAKNEEARRHFDPLLP